MAKGEWLIDFGEIKTMGEYRAIEKSWNEAITKSDYDALNAIMAMRIKSWEYDANPGDVKNYDLLMPSQWREARVKVRDALLNLFLNT